jgi:hypothetical protein
MFWQADGNLKTVAVRIAVYQSGEKRYAMRA